MRSCEIKFYKNPVTTKVINEIQEKINKLTLPKNFSYRPVLIHVNGVDDEMIASEFFHKLLILGSCFRNKEMSF